MDDEYLQYKDYIPIEIPKNDYELFIETLETKINGDYNDYLKMNAKVLHDTDKLNLNFIITIYEETSLNPFEDEIIFYIEFIDGERPYVQIISNFITPTMYDYRNYFLCLSKKFNYVFKKSKLAECQITLEELVSNIKYFLYYLKDCENFKTYIYFGEYDTNHVYHINDFMRNNKINFFKINQIKDYQFYDKILYVICTEIYFIVFEPIESNKALGIILFYNQLSEIEFNFEEVGYIYDKKEMKKRLKVIVSKTNHRILFKESDDEIKSSNKVKIMKLSQLHNSLKKPFKTFKTDSISIEKNINDKNIKKHKKSQKLSKSNRQSIQNNIINEDSTYDSNNNFEFLFVYKDEDDDNEVVILQNQYILFKQLIAKKSVLEDIGYANIISTYRLLFGHPFKINESKNLLRKIKEEIDKLIDYNKKLCEKYKDSKKEFDKKRIKKIINNIIYLCTKITGSLYEEDKINSYINIMRNYAEISQNIL